MTICRPRRRPVRLALAGIPKPAARVLVEHFRIDDEHSNAYTAWKQMGSPPQPSPDAIRAHGSGGRSCSCCTRREWRAAKDGQVGMEFPLPRHAVSLVRLSW